MPFPVSDFEICKTEKKLGVIFPGSFRAAMMLNNGGLVQTDEDDWEIYPFFDASDLKRISRTSQDIVKETESAKDWEGFPKSGIAIAGNGCGDILFLQPTIEDPNKLGETVFVFWHEEPIIELLADSFGELVGESAE